MAKKVMGADGKQYKVKKPFYKRVWFWVLVVIIIAAIGGAMGGGKDDKKDDSTAKSSQTSKKSASSSVSSKKDDGKITRAQFDAIKIGDLMKGAEGGATIDQLKQEFGEPSSSSSDTTNDVKTDLLTWDNVQGGFGANIIVSFTNGKAFGKNLTGFKLSRKQKIDLAAFNSWQNGMKYADFTSKYGQPDYYDESLIGGSKTVTAGYTSGVKGDFGATFNVTFTNDALSGKTQSNMK